ncbi:hypothetical protein HD597_012859 [Nonomuraea thailandensis]|uniref:Uncharacterized protein n=1 Tax=Nonomuraea thailandensis TaxID=1188745 RepID=A0A9X2KAF0_9ACTN|nr:hypothetical protein [Nonomuraea thailandensis]MCP2365755.1 hypothetical protein [Nonomuraea thailandensis]
MPQADLLQIEHDLIQFLTTAGFQPATDETGGFVLNRHADSISLFWSVGPRLDEMTVGVDGDHPAQRFLLEVVNIMAIAFAQLLAKAGYAVTLQVTHAEDGDITVRITSGPNMRSQ